MILELILKHKKLFLTAMRCSDFQRMDQNRSLALGFQMNFCEKAQRKLYRVFYCYPAFFINLGTGNLSTFSSN